VATGFVGFSPGCAVCCGHIRQARISANWQYGEPEEGAPQHALGRSVEAERAAGVEAAEISMHGSWLGAPCQQKASRKL